MNNFFMSQLWQTWKKAGIIYFRHFRKDGNPEKSTDFGRLYLEK
jgi:hypothetical protein